MITRQQAYVTSDKQTFVELDAAIGHELKLLLGADHDTDIVTTILKHRDKVIDLLSTTPTSQDPCQINGGPDAAAVNRELQDQKQ